MFIFEGILARGAVTTLLHRAVHTLDVKLEVLRENQ